MAITTPDSALTTVSNAKVLLWPGETVGLSQETLLTQLVSRASAMVSVLCDRRFTSTTHTEYHSGDGTRFLWLRNWPVTTPFVDGTHSVTVDVTGQQTFSYTYYEVNATHPAGEFVVHPGEEGHGLLEGYRCTWPIGFKNIKVIYTAGYSTIPAPVEQATLELIAYLHTMASQKLWGINSTTIAPGGGSVTTTEQNIPDRILKMLVPWKRIKQV